jgi:hypothetical protein
VTIDSGRDQADNAARIVTRGAGLSVKRSAPPASGALVRELEDLPLTETTG